MAWFSPRGSWKPKEKETKVEVKETQVGPNSVRYEAVKKEGGYRSPVLVEPYRVVKQPKKARKSYWDSYKDVKFDDEDYYPDTTFRSGSRYNEYAKQDFRPVKREVYKHEEKKKICLDSYKMVKFFFFIFYCR